MTNLQALAQEWRRIAKAQMEGAGEDDVDGLYQTAFVARSASAIYTRCADDLEKAGAMADDAIIEYVANHKNLLNRILYRHDEITERRREEIRDHPPRTGEGV